MSSQCVNTDSEPTHGYNCEKCGKKFTSIVSRKLHSLDCTVVPSIPGLKEALACPVVGCISKFFTHELLTLHLAESHLSLCNVENHDYGLREVYFTKLFDFNEWFSNLCLRYTYTFKENKFPLPGVQLFKCSEGQERQGKRFCPAFVKLKAEDNGHFTCTFSFIHAFHKFNNIPMIEVPRGNFCFVIKNKKQLPNYSSSVMTTPESTMDEQTEDSDDEIVFLTEAANSTSSVLRIPSEVYEKPIKPEVRVENLWEMQNVLPANDYTYGMASLKRDDDTLRRMSRDNIPRLTLTSSSSSAVSADCPTRYAPHPRYAFLPVNTPQIYSSGLKRRNDELSYLALNKQSLLSSRCPEIPSLSRNASRKATYPTISALSVSNGTVATVKSHAAPRRSSGINSRAKKAYEQKRASLNNALKSMNVHDSDLANQLFNARFNEKSTTPKCPKEQATKEKDRALREKVDREKAEKSLKEKGETRNTGAHIYEENMTAASPVLSYTHGSPTKSPTVRGSANQTRYSLRQLPNYVLAPSPKRRRRVSDSRSVSRASRPKMSLSDSSDTSSEKPLSALPLNDNSLSTTLDETEMQSKCQMIAHIASFEMGQMHSISTPGEYGRKYQVIRNFHRIKEAALIMEMFRDSDLYYDNETASLLQDTEEKMWKIIAKLGNSKNEIPESKRSMSSSSHQSEKNVLGNTYHQPCCK